MPLCLLWEDAAVDMTTRQTAIKSSALSILLQLR